MLIVLNPLTYVSGLLVFSRLVRREWRLVVELTRRELFDQFSRQALGRFWAFAHPVILILIYIFLFRVVFGIKIEQSHELPLDYTSYLLIGLAAWLPIQETLTKSCTSITGNANLVKQIVFNIDVLPVKDTMAVFLTRMISYVVVFGYILASGGRIFETVFLWPVLIGLEFMLCMGIAFVLSAISVYVRDVREFNQVLSLVLIYAAPVVFLLAWVPDKLRFIFYANPFTYVVLCFQDALYYGRIEHPAAWIVFPVISVGSLVLGYRFFHWLKPRFGNVL